MTPLLPAVAGTATFAGQPRRNVVHQTDALSLLRALPSGSVDAIVTDPPYNLTNLDFEQAVDWEAFWLQARRVLASKASPVIMFSQQPFTTDLINSNRRGFRYELIWEKTLPLGFLDAKRRPLRCHENILIFADTLPEYEPQMERTDGLKASAKSQSAAHYNKREGVMWVDDGSRYPRSVWKFSQNQVVFGRGESLHPTQKPIALMERLMLTYTRANWLVADPFAGSGSTLVAAQKLGRHYIGCDISATYCDVARARLAAPYTLPLFAANA